MQNRKPFETFISTILLVAIAMLAPVALFCFWSDSEMWAVTSNFHMFSDQWHNHLIKPLFGLGLFLVSHIGNIFNANIMDASRLFFYLNSLLSVYLFFRLSNQLTKDRSLSLMVVLALVSTSYFWERSFRVRSDLITLTIYLIVLNLLYGPQVGHIKTRMLSWLLMVINIFITAKSLIFLLLVCWSYQSLLIPSGQFKSKKLLLGVAFFGCLLVFMNQEALLFFINSFNGTGGELPYFSIQRWEHVFRFLSKNLMLYLFLFFPLASKVIYSKWSSDDKFFKLSCGLLLWFFLHPNKFPFFLYMLLPFILLGLLNNPFFKKNILKLLAGNHWQKAVIFVCIVFLSYQVVKHGAYVFYEHNNINQKKTQSHLCSELNQFPKARVLDPIGVCPKRKNSFFWFLGPSHENKLMLKSIVDHKVDIILLVAKMGYLQPELGKLGQKDFFYVSPGVLVRALTFDNSQRVLTHEDLKLELEKEFHVKSQQILSELSNLGGAKKKKLNLPANYSAMSAVEKKSLYNEFSSAMDHGDSSLPFIDDYDRIKLSPFSIGLSQAGYTLNSLFRHDSEL